ncbi:MAG: DUF4912 domain-containing protein [Elusimicrobiota bacterium]|nr:DUF4912 domain-containing protein [Elusimicrobiota bacterium]
MLNNNQFNFIINEKLDIPYSYNENKIFIMPRDPDIIFIYWDINDTLDYDSSQKNIFLSKISITIKNINSSYNYNIKPDKHTKSWYFNIKYKKIHRENIIAELGVYHNNGYFIILATSNIINMPNKFYHKKDYIYWEKYNKLIHEYVEKEFDFKNSSSSKDYFMAISFNEFKKQ